MPAASDLTAHPLRDRILGEIHARPFAALTVPCRIGHFAFLTDAGQGEADRAALSGLRQRAGLGPLDDGQRHARMNLGELALRWERHGEFTTYSWERADISTPVLWPEGFAQPGPLVAAADLVVASGLDLPALFPGAEAAIARTRDGAVGIATDFRAGADGFVRIAVRADNVTPEQAGPLVQRLLEIDTYRTLAMLGLPEAQRAVPLINEIETALPVLIERIRASGGLGDARMLLEQLSSLAAELEEASAASAFRLGATRAYAELVRIRLETIDETPGARSWSGFLSRRLSPAMRTCRTIETRQADLSLKLSRAAQLLRTQVEVDLAHQNRDLLTAMNERVRQQTRLQQTVEGLSVVAITYYAASLLHLLLEGAHSSLKWLDPAVGTALGVLPIAALVTWQIRRLRFRHGLFD